MGYKFTLKNRLDELHARKGDRTLQTAPHDLSWCRLRLKLFLEEPSLGGGRDIVSNSETQLWTESRVFFSSFGNEVKSWSQVGRHYLELFDS